MRLSITDLLPGTEYAIQVRSDDGTLQSEWSPVFEYTTMHDIVLPKTPTNVVWSSIGDAFYAEWDSITVNNNEEYSAITRYEIEFTGNSVTKVVSVPQSTEPRSNYTLTFEENKSLFGTAAATVAIRVRAVDNKDLKSNWSGTLSANNPVPNPPASASTTPGVGNIAVSWTPSTSDDVVGYNVYFGTTAGFVPASGNRIYSGNATSMIFTTSLTATFYFKIRAVDKFGQESTDASTSGAANPPLSIDTTPPGPPTSVTTTQGFDTAVQRPWIDVTWVAPADSDVDKFEIRYRSNGAVTPEYMFVGRDVTTARLPNLIPLESYYVDVRAIDFSGNPSTWAHSASEYPISMNPDTTAPSTPAAPTASVGVQKIQVVVSGTKAGGGSMEADVAYYQVFASTTNDFTPANANMLGTIQQGPAMVEIFQIPAASSTPSATSETWYVKVKAVDFSGNVSPASAQVTAAVGLIVTANIGDAQITSAKIQNLEANKIVAGTGFINNLTVKSTFTLGDATNDGVIQSYDYGTSGGTTGFRLAKSGLIIKTGSIEAAALKIQVGDNIVQPMFADFSGHPSAYDMFAEPGYEYEVRQTGGIFGNGYIHIETTSSGMPGVYLETPTIPGHTFYAEQNELYIISYYAWLDAPGSEDINFWGITYDSNDDQVDTEGIAGAVVNSTIPTRFSFYWGPTAPDTRAVGLTVGLQSAGAVNIGGIQVERKIGSLTTPTPWSRPGSTAINGGQIRTGEIRSNTELNINGQTQPMWYVDLNGSAQFSNLAVRGETVLGMADEDTGTSGIAQAGSVLRSNNYVAGEKGWAVYSNGMAELRSIVLGSMDGSAIEDGTLKADAIQTGSVLSSEVTVTGNLHAVGDMGEDIGLSGDGFLVLGPYQVNIISLSVSSNVVTITTAINHGFSVGNKLVTTGLPATYNGIFTISSVTANTVSFPLTTANLSTTTMSGIAKSKSTNPAIVRPTLIEFPTDGANPNIISGQLKADNLTVLKSASIQGPTTLENTTLTITAGVVPPRAAPTVTSHYDTVGLSSTVPFPYPLTSSAYGVTRDGSGNYFVYGKSATTAYVSKFDSNGVFLNHVKTNVLSESIPQRQVGPLLWLRPYTYTIYPRGIVYSSAYDKFYITFSYIYNAPAWQNPNGPAQAAMTYKREYVQSFTPTGWNEAFPMEAYLEDMNNDAGWRGTTIGWDWIANVPLHVLSANSASPTIRPLTLDGSGHVTGFGSAVTINQMTGMVDPRFVTKVSTVNTPEFGGTRYVLKEIMGSGATGTYANNLNRWTTIDAATNNPVVNEGWPSATVGIGNGGVWGGYFDPLTGRFWGLQGNGTMYKYESDDSYWSFDSLMTTVRTYAYSWYDSNPLAPGGGPGGTYTITQKQIASNVARLTTSVAHGMSGSNDIGRWVEVTGVGSPYDGWAQITAVPTTTTFEYNLVAANQGATGASGTMLYRVHESNLSPVATFTMSKRSKVKIDISNIPYFDSGEYPNKARVYMAYPFATEFHRRLTIDYDNTVGIMNPSTTHNSLPLPMPGSNNGFSIINNPSKIVTTSGQSWWDGSGNARFLDVQYIGDDWTNVTFQNGWGNYGSPYQTVQYRREGRKVILRGLAAGGTVGSAIFTLPVGYRPIARHIYNGVVNASTFGSGAASTGTAHTHQISVRDGSFRVNVDETGVVAVAIPSGATQANGYISLSGIEFYLD